MGRVYLLPGISPSNGRARNAIVALCYVVVAVGFATALAEGPDAGVESVAVEEGDPSPASNAAPAAPGGTPEPPTDGRAAATVIRVVDGDTLDVRYGDGSLDAVQLRGVRAPALRDRPAPESFHGVPDSAAGRRCLAGAARNATDFLGTRLAGEQVELRTADDAPRDDAGRLLATVVHDGRAVNRELVEAGYARAAPADEGTLSRHADVQRAAHRAERGLWSCRP